MASKNITFQSRFDLQQSPFPLLLKLEFIVLGIVFSSALWILWFRPSGFVAPIPSPLPTIAALGCFIAIGLVIPKNPFHQLIYCVIEFFLIGFIFVGAIVPFFQLLFITIIIRNCILFKVSTIQTSSVEKMAKRVARSIVTGLTCAGYLFCQIERLRHPVFAIVSSPAQTWIFGWVSTLTFGLVVLFLQLFVDAILKEQESRQALAIAHTQLQHYAVQVEDLATVQERNRIARDIHDSLGHSLSIFNLHLEAALRLFHKNPSEAEALLRELQGVGQQAMREVSHSVTTLRADPLDGQSLSLVLLNLLEQFKQSTGIQPHCYWIENRDWIKNRDWIENHMAHPLDRSSLDWLESLKLTPGQRMTIYRIIQESLTNVRKHADATKIEIRLETRGQQGNDDFSIMIDDNGQGFDPTAQCSGFGLQGMQERLAVLSGHFEIRSKPNHGCQILASFPIVNPTSLSNPSP